MGVAPGHAADRASTAGAPARHVSRAVVSDGTRARAMQVYRAALRAADASDAVKRHLELGHGVLRVGEHVLPLAADARIVVVGAGKAGGRMAQAVEDTLGPRVSGGFVSVKEGHGAP